MSASFRHKSDCSVQKSMSGSHFCDPEPADEGEENGSDGKKNGKKNDTKNGMESSLLKPSLKATHPHSATNLMTTSISVPASLTVKEIREARASSFQGTGIPVQQLDQPDGEVGRETWNKKLDFILSVVGFAVDLSNVRFFIALILTNFSHRHKFHYFRLLLLFQIFVIISNFCHRFKIAGLEISLPVLQKWWWCFPHSIPGHVGRWRNSIVFHGTCSWSVPSERSDNMLGKTCSCL